jgi:hypothetical protein
MLVRITHHPGDARQGSYFAGSTLGVATRDQDLSVGVFPMGAADGGTRVLIGRSRHRTSIEYDYVRLSGGFDLLQAATLKRAHDSSAVGLCGPATKALHEKALRN